MNFEITLCTDDTGNQYSSRKSHDIIQIHKFLWMSFGGMVKTRHHPSPIEKKYIQGASTKHVNELLIRSDKLTCGQTSRKNWNCIIQPLHCHPTTTITFFCGSLITESGISFEVVWRKDDSTAVLHLLHQFMILWITNRYKTAAFCLAINEITMVKRYHEPGRQKLVLMLPEGRTYEKNGCRMSLCVNAKGDPITRNTSRKIFLNKKKLLKAYLIAQLFAATSAPIIMNIT